MTESDVGSDNAGPGKHKEFKILVDAAQASPCYDRLPSELVDNLKYDFRKARPQTKGISTPTFETSQVSWFGYHP